MGRAFEYRKARKLKRWGNMSRTFTRIGKEITMAAKTGGADPDMNPRLRVLMQNAKAANMPKDTVERAIKKATEKDASDYKEIVYEGYGPPRNSNRGGNRHRQQPAHRGQRPLLTSTSTEVRSARRAPLVPFRPQEHIPRETIRRRLTGGIRARPYGLRGRTRGRRGRMAHHRRVRPIQQHTEIP